MKKILIILFSVGILAFGFDKETVLKDNLPKEYIIKGLPNKYYCKIIHEKSVGSNGLFKEGTIKIYNQKNQEVINKKKADLKFNHEDILGNEISFEKQKIIILEDYNFDGIMDIGINDGLLDIYLSQGKSLVKISEFSQLALDSGRNLYVDKKNKLLMYSYRALDLWVTRKYKVVDNKPQLIQERTDDAYAVYYPFVVMSEINYEGNKKTYKDQISIDFNDDNLEFNEFSQEPIVYFQTENGKKLFIFERNEKTLYYAFTAPNNDIELSYPNILEEINKISIESQKFKFSSNGDKLTFKILNTTYEIYQNRKNGKIEDIGIIIEIDGKPYNLKGKLETLKGSLKNINVEKYNNVSLSENY